MACQARNIHAGVYVYFILPVLSTGRLCTSLLSRGVGGWGGVERSRRHTLEHTPTPSPNVPPPRTPYEVEHGNGWYGKILRPQRRMKGEACSVGYGHTLAYSPLSLRCKGTQHNSAAHYSIWSLVCPLVWLGGWRLVWY